MAQQVEEGDRRFYPDDPLWTDPDLGDIGDRELAEFELSMQYDFLDNVFGDPAEHDGPAVNVNTLGEVPDSSWFVNRIGRGRLSAEDVIRGRGGQRGPAPGKLTVIGRPGAGIQPKFTVRDSRGEVFLIKIDPVEWPGMATTAEFVVTELFWAIGYHVPDNTIYWLDPDHLEIAADATWQDPAGYERSLEQEEIDEWLSGQRRSEDGEIRVVASRFIDGDPIGSFRYYGTRPDDPNDIYPHELRRELRALRAFSAWLNHDDSRALNSLMMVVQEEGRRFVRHHLIDFGSALGSRGVEPQEARAGYEYMVEMDKVLARLFTLGIHTEPWERVDYEMLPAVGRFEAEFYEPWRWKPQYPNPAFDRMDAADAFWAASIMSRFDEEMIRGIIERADLRDEGQRRILGDVLLQRLRKTVRYWIGRTNPLDTFRLEEASGDVVLAFDNAAVRLGAAEPGDEYAVSWFRLDNLENREEPVGEPVRTSRPQLEVPREAWGPRDDVGFRYAVVRIGVERSDRPHWAEPIMVTLRERNGERDVVGIERPVKSPAFAIAPPGTADEE